MNVLETKMSPIIFPGQMARLEVDIQSEFDLPDSMFLTKIWRFYNKIENPESLINRIEIWQDRKGIALVQIFFNALGCEQMKQAFSDKMKVQIFHYHADDWCKLEVTHREGMKKLLDLISSAHEFVGNSHSEMEVIASKLIEDAGLDCQKVTVSGRER